MSGGGPWLRAVALAGGLAGACSLFVPDDEEYVGGGGSGDDGGVTGGSGGAFGGSAGASGSGGIAGSGGVGGSSGGSGGSGGVGGAGGEGGVGGASGGAAGSGGSAAGAGGTGGSGGSTGGTGGSGGSACTPGPKDLTAQPSALYLMLDRTSSMSGAEWSAATQGIGDWLSNPTLSGSAALQYFPAVGGQGSCTGNGYDNPAIGMAALPGIASAMQSSLNSTNLVQSTSQMEGVLDGGLTYALGYASANPAMQVNFVLLTDFNGTDACGASTNQLLSIVSSAAQADPPVRTHVVSFVVFGVNVLDSLAQAGGSQQATDANTPAEVQNALSRAAVSCRFSLPAIGTPGSSAMLDTGGSNSISLTQVPNAANCQNDAFFLSGTPPTALVLCPDTCALLSLSAAPQLSLDVTCP